MSACRLHRFGLISLLVFGIGLARAATAGEATVGKWEVFDIVLAGPEDHLTPFDVEVKAEAVRKGGETMRIPGFYDGGSRWIVRFCPPEVGEWTVTTQSPEESLNGNRTDISVEARPESGSRGPLAISEKHPDRFIRKDAGEAFVIAFECDWLFALDFGKEELSKTRTLISQIAGSGFDMVVMNVFAFDAKWGDRGAIAPEHNYAKPTAFPFGGTNAEPDHSTLSVAFFQHLDRVIAHLDGEGLLARLMIYVWNKQVNWPERDSVDDNRFFDYVVKRYQAYPNLVWDVSKEALSYDHADAEYISDRIRRLRRLDGHRRLVTVHDYAYCNDHPDKVDFISIQEWKPQLYSEMLKVSEAHAGKPVMNIEHGGYEKTTHSIFDGAYNDALVCLDRNYQCVFAGAYSTYYWQNSSWYEVVHDPLALPEATRPGFALYGHLRRLFERYPFNGLKSVVGSFSPPCLTDNETVWMFYLSPGAITVHGSVPGLGPGDYTLRWFDPVTGTFSDNEARTLKKGGWLALRRPESVASPMAIAVLERKSEATATPKEL